VKGRVFVFMLLAVTTYCVSAASLDVYTDIDESYVGQPITLTVRITGDIKVSRPKLPSMDGFKVQEAGESRYEERTMGSGGNSKKVTMEYSWRLIPTLTGHFTIPSLTVTMGKETVKSQIIPILIKDPEHIEGYHLFLTADSRKAFPMIPIRIHLKWLFSSEVSRPDMIIPFYKNSSIKVTDLPPPSSNTSDIYQISVDGHTVYAVQSAEVFEGKQYASLSMSWDILPEVSGPLKLNPILLSFQRGVLDKFGRKSYENAAIPSNSLSIDILPLPEEMKQFSGGILVADQKLNVSASLNQDRIYPGDPLELTLRIQGLNNPDMTDFNGVGGMKEVSGIITADTAGLVSEVSGDDKIIKQKIRFISSHPKVFPSLSFPYYNMETGKVEYCQSQPVPITVLKLEETETNAQSHSIKEGKAPVPESQIGIRDNMKTTSDGGARFLGTLYLYRKYLVFILLFIVLFILLFSSFSRIFERVKSFYDSVPLKNLKRSLIIYEKEPTKEQLFTVYDLFWKWMYSLPFLESKGMNKEELLEKLKGHVNNEIYHELQSFAELLESLWGPVEQIQWKRVYIKLPERVQKEMKKTGKTR